MTIELNTATILVAAISSGVTFLICYATRYKIKEKLLGKYDLKKHIPNLPDEFVRLEVKKLETGHVRYEVTAWSNDYSDNTDMAL